MRILSQKDLEEKKILIRAKRRQAKKIIKSETRKEKIANAILKRLQILHEGEVWKEIIERKNEWLKKIEYHQQNKTVARQTVEQTEKETKFWTSMIEMKEKMNEVSKQRKMHEKLKSALKTEEIKIEKDMVREFI
ncbi:MAG: hypothetical protein KAI72_08420 [Candidatus Pacebacteria bacterium]|nr:hypothetical protein [Candidatus Paceibacterota bacterium]